MPTILTTGIPFSSEVLGVLRDEIFNDEFYLQNGEIRTDNRHPGPYAVGRFFNHSSGHYRFRPGYVHGQDSLAAAGQLAYAFFMQGSLDEVISQVPKMPLDQLVSIVKNKLGGAHLKRINEFDFRALPYEFNGEMYIKEVKGNPEHGYVFTTPVKFSRVTDTKDMLVNVASSHRGECEFQVKF